MQGYERYIIANLTYDTQPYYYRTAEGSELDLVLVRGGQPVVGVEIKYTNAPTLSRGNHIASRDLGGISILVVTPSAQDFQPAEQVQVCSLTTLWEHLHPYGVLGI